MANPGRTPSETSKMTQTDWTDVPNVPFLDGEKRECPVEEPADATVRWWEQVRILPHASLWEETDWIFLEDLARLKQTFYTGSMSDTALAEMRRREDQVGTTSEARRKNRIRYIAAKKDTAPVVPAGVTDISTGRRARLTKEA